MKLFLFFLLLLILMISSSSYSQSSDSIQDLRSGLYKKAWNQKTTATVMLAGGGALLVTGYAIISGRIFHEIGESFDGRHDNTFQVGEVIFYTGLASMLGSIPLFIVATHKRNEAKNLALYIRSEKTVVLSNASFNPVSYPAISLKINF